MSNWEVHLRAASGLILLLYGVSNGSNVEQDSERLEHDAHGVDNAALHFFTGAIIWFDTLACVSTGSHPYLSEYHNQLLSEKALMSSAEMRGDSKIRLDSIMGCRRSSISFEFFFIWRTHGLNTSRKAFEDPCIVIISCSTIKKLEILT